MPDLYTFFIAAVNCTPQDQLQQVSEVFTVAVLACRETRMREWKWANLYQYKLQIMELYMLSIGSFRCNFLNLIIILKGYEYNEWNWPIREHLLTSTSNFQHLKTATVC